MQGIPDPHLIQLNLEEPKITIAIGGKRGLGLEGTIDVGRTTISKALQGDGWGHPQELYYMWCGACGGVTGH